jgi:hypothetical protein
MSMAVMFELRGKQSKVRARVGITPSTTPEEIAVR